ncbi:hypothetical protein ABPG74_018458 [Tetrahymena malaccensis]
MDQDKNNNQQVQTKKENGFFVQTLLDLMKIQISSQEQIRQMPSIIQNYMKLHVEKSKVTQILIQLEYSGLNKDLRRYENKEMNISNLILMSTFIFTMVKFKRMSYRIIFGGSLLICKSFYLDHFCMNKYLQRVGLQYNDQVAQEVRLLYRFYFPDEKISQDFKVLCDKYKKISEIRKSIHNSRNQL